MADSPASVPVPPSPLRFARGTVLALSLLISINLVNYIDRYNLAAVEALIEKEPGFFAADDPYVQTKLGSLAFAFMATYMLIAPIFGWLGDRYSRWKIIAFGVALWSMATFACGLTGGFVALFLLRCLVGVGEAAYGPAAPAIIADLIPIQRRGQIISWFYAAIPVGSALGFALGGVIAGLEFGGKPLGWRWVFFLMGPPGLLLAAWAFFMRDPPRGMSDEAGEAASGTSGGMRKRSGLGPIEEYRRIWRTRSYMLDTLGMTAMAFAIGGVAFWMPRYIAEFRQGPEHIAFGQVATIAQAAGQGMLAAGPVSAAPVWSVQNSTDANVQAWFNWRVAQKLPTVNLLFGGVTVVAGLGATLAGGWLGDRLRPHLDGSYFWVSGIGMLIGFVLFLAVLVVPFPWAWGVLFLAIFCLFFNTGPTNTILANVIHPTMRAGAVALNIFVIHAFGDAISPAIIGLVADLRRGPLGDAGLFTGLNAGFLLVSGMILVSGLLWCRGAKYLEEDTRNAIHMVDAKAE